MPEISQTFAQRSLHVRVAHKCLDRTFHQIRHVLPYDPSVQGLPRFPRSFTPEDLPTWHDQSSETIGTLVQDHHLLAFKQLQQVYNIPAGKLLLHCQLLARCHLLWHTSSEGPPHPCHHIHSTHHGLGTTPHYLVSQSHQSTQGSHISDPWTGVGGG